MLRSRHLVKQASQLEDLAHHRAGRPKYAWWSTPPPQRPAGPRAAAFMPQSRGCRVRLREEVLSGVEEVMHEGIADLAISSYSIGGYLGAELSAVEFVAVAHPEHSLHRLGRELTFQDLESQLQVVIRDSGRAQPRDVGWLGAEQRWTVGSLGTAATFVSSGLGFAWLPRHMIERELREGVLKPLPLDQGGSRHCSTFIQARKRPWARPQILIDLLRNFDTAPLDVPFAAPQA